MTTDKTVYAKWIEDTSGTDGSDRTDGSDGSGTTDKNKVPDVLNGDDHYAYIIGYPEGDVRPNGQITRAEVATIFFRMLTDEARTRYWNTENSYTDVALEAWYNNAVSTAAVAGIVSGYPDGTFAPNAPITRAEFAAIAARFDSGPYTGDDYFSDTAGHWANEYINRAAQRGWISGYEDGTFKPEQKITRAEAMTLVNNILNRKPENADSLDDEMIAWPDNSDTSAWYYLAVQEATNSHHWEKGTDNTHEAWTGMREVRDWAALEQTYSNAQSAGEQESVYTN